MTFVLYVIGATAETRSGDSSLGRSRALASDLDPRRQTQDPGGVTKDGLGRRGYGCHDRYNASARARRPASCSPPPPRQDEGSARRGERLSGLARSGCSSTTRFIVLNGRRPQNARPTHLANEGRSATSVVDNELTEFAGPRRTSASGRSREIDEKRYRAASAVANEARSWQTPVSTKAVREGNIDGHDRLTAVKLPQVLLS